MFKSFENNIFESSFFTMTVSIFMIFLDWVWVWVLGLGVGVGVGCGCGVWGVVWCGVRAHEHARVD